MGLMACPADVDNDTGRQIDQVACNWFVAEASKKLYDVDDFTKDANGHWLVANEIADFVRISKDWSKLEMANSQSVLADASQGAGNGQPVIAVMQGNPHGHVALVLAGELKPSTT